MRLWHNDKPLLKKCKRKALIKRWGLFFMSCFAIYSSLEDWHNHAEYVWLCHISCRVFKKDLKVTLHKWYYIFILIVGGKYGKRFT